MSAAALDLPRAPSLPGRAVLVSVAIHAAALLLLPGLAKQAEEQLPPLVATLRFLPAAQPAVQASVSSPAPQARSSEPVSRPLRSAAKETPVAARSETPAARVLAAAPDAAPTAVPETTARSDLAPTPAAPLAAAPAPAPALESTALDDYGRALSDLLARQQQYPRLAALRGWEGEVRLRLKVARKGNLVGVQVVRSSGHEVLDQHAVQMVQGAALPSPPDSFGDREIQVVVPIHYKLQKST